MNCAIFVILCAFVNEALLYPQSKPHSQNGLTSIYKKTEYENLLQQYGKMNPLVYLRDRHGSSILNAFAKSGAWQILGPLLKSGNFDINEVNKRGDSLLSTAANKGQLEVIDLLIELGANIENKNVEGKTPLILAAEKLHEKSVVFLIQRGANVNVVSKDGSTPLIMASINGMQTAIELLIKKGANINDVDRHENSPLSYAADNGHEKAVKFLLNNGANINAPNKYKRTPIMLAASKGHENVVQLLIQSGSDIHSVGNNGETVLTLSVERGLEKAVEMLVENGADVNIVNVNDDTALILAIERGYEKIANILIKNGANVGVMNSDGNSVLIMAADIGLEDTIELIVQNGADVNVVNNDGNSALILAARNGLDRSVELLIENGANINSVNKNIDTALLMAAGKGAEKSVELLIQNGASVNDTNVFGNTPLILAAEKGHEQIVDLLIKKGAFINAVNNIGNSALRVAAIEGRDAVVRLLLQNGADPIIKNVNGDATNVANFRVLPNEVKFLNGDVAKKACHFYTNLTKSGVFKIREFEDRIIGGELAEIGEFPWMAALGYLNRLYKISFSCGGTLISDTFVLTAAHCVKDIRRPVVVRLGKVNLNDEDGGIADNHNIRQIIRHPKFSITKKKNDIALIRLVDRIWFSNLIQPACLQTDLRDEDADFSLIVTGWGQTQKLSVSNDLLKTSIKTVPLSECNKTLLEYNVGKNLASFRNGISESQYCAYDVDGKRDSCQGDSGGPLQIIHPDSSPATVIGVVSFGVTCGNGLPSIYTRIAFYADWIASHVWPNGEIPTPLLREE